MSPDSLQRFSRRVLLRSLLTLFLPWALLILVLTVLLYDRLLDAKLAPRLHDQQASLSEGLGVLNRYVASLRGNLLFLSQHPAMGAVLERGDPQNLALLRRLMLDFSQSSGRYDQIRWLDERGQERVRVDLREGRAVRVPDPELQNKADRYFFVEAMQLPPGAFYLSRFDLNQERGQLERPLKPTLRAATPLFDKAGRARGVLVLNYLGQVLLDRVGQISTRYGGYLELVDFEGYWIYSRNPGQAWGFMLDRPQDTVASRYPQSWARMRSQPSGQFIDAAGLWAFVRFDPGDSGDDPDGAERDSGRDWLLVSLLPVDILQSLRLQVFWQMLAFGAFMLFVGLAVVLRLALTEADRDRALAGLEARGDELAQSNRQLTDTVEALQRTRGALIQAEKLSSLGTLVAGVAHELNTPIGAASVAASALDKSREQLEQGFREGLQRSALERFLQRNAEGLAIILANLGRMALLTRAFKQLATDRASVERRRFDLVALVDEVMLVFAPRLKATSHRVLLNLPPSLMLDSYPGPLGQIVQNLIENALVHAFAPGESGTVRVRADIDDGGRHCVIEVEDDGCGMTEEVLARIFDPFFTTRRGSGGTGLGLHLTHQLAVDILGAELQVSSTPGRGTLFRVRLPLG